MGRLEYDSGAFAFFFLALWLAILVPFTYSSIKGYLAAQKPPPVLTSQASYGEFPQHLVENKNALAREQHKHAQTSSYKSLALVALGWSLVVAYLLMLSDTGMSEIAHFDPFEILSISPGATEIQIKKAYKKLSLVYHPDRCTASDKAGKALCETRFVMVAKAYEALTDPIAKDNFERYGNPDGRQAMEMSIGLPKWLLESDNQTWVIASYLLLCIVVFPASVMLLTWNAAREGEKVQKRVYPDTEEMFRVGIRNGTSFNVLMELFSHAAEFRPYAFRNKEEKEFVYKLRNELLKEDMYPNPSREYLSLRKQGLMTSEGNDKVQVLLAIHLNRLYARLAEHPGLLEDLESMLQQSPVLLKSIVGHARVTCNFQTLCAAIMFQQCFNQAIVPGPAYPIKMLPHAPENIPQFAKEVLPKLKSNTLGLDVLLANSLRPEEQKVQLLQDVKENAEFEQALLALPFREHGKHEIGTLKDEVKTKLTTRRQAKDIKFEFEPESYQGDLIRVVAKMKQRIRQTAAPQTNKARTPFLPHEVREEWYFVLTGGPQPKGFNNITSERENKIVQFNVAEEDRTVEELVCDMPFGTAFNPNDWINTADFPVGLNRLYLYCFSNVYPGLESRAEIDLTLLDPATMPKYKHHEEDLQLEKEGMSIYSLLQPQGNDGGDDSDFDDGVEEEQQEEDEE